MFNYTLPNGVPVKNVLKAIVTGQRQPSQSHSSSSYPSQPTPQSATPSHLDTSSAYDGIFLDDEISNADKIDPYKVYEHGESGTGGPGRVGKGQWDDDGDEGDWGKVMDALDVCFDDAQKVAQDLKIRETDDLEVTLEDQVAWLTSHQAAFAGKEIPALKTLAQVYERAGKTVRDIEDAENKKQAKMAKKTDAMLEEAFTYLSNLAVFDAINWHAEVIGGDFHAEFDDLVQPLHDERASESRFKSQANKVKEELAVAQHQITDQQGKQADRDIRALLKEVLGDSKVPDPPSAPPSRPSATEGKAAKIKSILKPHKSSKEPEKPKASSSSKSKPGPTSVATCFKDGGNRPDPEPASPEKVPSLYNYNGQVVTRSAMELLEMEDKIAERGGLFERDGVVMTASALSLLQAQEALARGDTAGQGEWGPDSWDGIRGQYIPKWAKKLTAADKWPLVDDDGRPLRNDDGTRMEDWFEPDVGKIEARNLLKYGMEGVVDYAY